MRIFFGSQHNWGTPYVIPEPFWRRFCGNNRIHGRAALKSSLLFLAIFSLALSVGAFAQPINVSNTPGVPSASPRIATDSQGNVHAVWVEQAGGTTGDVYYAKGTLANLQIGAAVNLSNTNRVICETLEMCSIDVDGLDRVYVVWIERDPGRILLRTNTGGVWDAAIEIASGSVYDAPRVAATAGGDLFIIYWNNEGHVFSRARVGGAWEETKDVGNWDNRSKMADIALGTNKAGAAWVERATPDGPYQTAYAERALTYNASWSSTFIVAPMAESHQHPTIEMDASDTAHVFWTTLLDESTGTRVVHYVRSSGAGFTAAVAISRSEFLHYPFSTERDGEIYVVWQVGGYGGGSSVDYNIRGTDGVWKGAASIDQSYGCTYTDVAVTPDRGIAFFVWDRYLGTTGAEIYGWAKTQAAVNPNIKVGRTRLTFGAVAGGVATASQSVLVENTGTGEQRWTATESTSWMNVSPAAGAGKGSIDVTVDAAGLGAGSYQGVIQIADPDATGYLPKTITVALTVYASNGATANPFGSFDTPLNNAAVASSIAVTGWALDDIEAALVKIYRDPVGSEPAGRVYIGDAVFVEGTRPDVELAYPAYPLCYRAGWGYMLLTNFLPNGGNGTYVLRAYATDREGHEVLLGSKTIVCDNAHAVKPFGAIDTPTQGGEISGSLYYNFGWALTPMPNSIPTDGSTLGVWVDGELIGRPTYNNFRDDIAALFPGYANSNGAVGVFELDTTKYDNGAHNIAWSVRDGAGNEDGIGSRFFSIVNSDSPAPAAELEASGTASAGGMRSIRRGSAAGVGAASHAASWGRPAGSAADAGERLAEVSQLSKYSDAGGLPVYARRGYDRSGPPESIVPSLGEGPLLVISELERVEILLDDKAWATDVERRTAERAGLGAVLSDKSNQRLTLGGGSVGSVGSEACWEGYLIVGDELRRLPIGSTLNSAAGVFSWQLGPGFLGDFHLVFIDRSTRLQRRMTIKIGVRS